MKKGWQAAPDHVIFLLIEAVRERAAEPARATDMADTVPTRVFPVALPEQIVDAQRALGFELPVLLKELYLQVGNGGYGPGYGLIGIAGGAQDYTGKSLVDLYKGFAAPDPDDVHWQWPSRLLPVVNLGCGMYACIDVSSAEGRVVWFAPDARYDEESWDDAFLSLASSTADWLRSWLAGEDLFESAWDAKFGGDDREEAGQSAYERLQPHIGVVDSGGKQLSENTGEGVRDLLKANKSDARSPRT